LGFEQTTTPNHGGVFWQQEFALMVRRQDLAKQLSQDVFALHELWRQRDKLVNDKAILQAEKDRVSDLLFQTGSFNQALEDDFNSIVRKLDKAQAQIDACQRRVEDAEQSLHTILPLANETFQRLSQSFQQATHEQDFNSLLAQLHPEAIEQFKVHQEQARLQESQNTNPLLPTPIPSFDTIPLETKLRELATLCPKSFELRKLQIPGLPFFALQTDQPQAVSIQGGATIIRQWSQEEIQQNRNRTMQAVVDSTNTLIDLAIQLLEFA
jgi:hypothetical protein